MKKLILTLFFLALAMGTSLSAEEIEESTENLNPFGIYISGGYGETGTGLIALGVDWNFTQNLYLYAELFGTQFNPFSLGALGGLEYEFIRNPFQEGSDFTYYLRAGGAFGGSSLDSNRMLITSATGSAGLNLDLENAGLIFTQFRQHLGIQINPSEDKKLAFLWSSSLAFGYRF